jgi:heme-degrading monooxygenase HmoA
MVARVTTADIDTVRTTAEKAVEVFRDSVMPALHDQPGYEGSYVLLSPAGKALVVTFWATESNADAGIAGARSFYAEQVEKFTTIYRSPPGRESYDVVLADAPDEVSARRSP